MSNQFIGWTNSLSVGNATIDQQHKKIFSLLDCLFKAYIANNPEDIKNIISDLVDYSIYHFETEEEILRRNFTKNVQEHIQEHEKFIAEVTSIGCNFDSNSRLQTFKLMTFLQKWILQHISGVDQKFMSWFKTQ